MYVPAEALEGVSTGHWKRSKCDAGTSNGSKMIVFADDILRNRSVHSQDDHTELQHGVNTLVVWS